MPAGNTNTNTLAGKTCLVTGGASGLGKAIAAKFFSEGANVVICDVNEERLQQTLTELQTYKSGDNGLNGFKVDVTSAEEVQGLFDEIARRYLKLDILVNNAGIMDKFDPVGTVELEEWEKVMAVNVTAPMLLSRLAVQSMLSPSSRGGCIINIVSLAGKAGFIAGELWKFGVPMYVLISTRIGAAYTTSKHAMVGLTKNTASFYGGKGIRCNALMCGGMDTNIVDAFKTGVNAEGLQKACAQSDLMNPGNCDVKEVAEVCLWLTGAEVINGACIPVDKGWSGMLG